MRSPLFWQDCDSDSDSVHLLLTLSKSANPVGNVISRAGLSMRLSAGLRVTIVFIKYAKVIQCSDVIISTISLVIAKRRHLLGIESVVVI